jgi:methylenetetrahydrofolate reductase (NADPH)
MRIIDRINAISLAKKRSKESNDDSGIASGFFYSFEFFPPKVRDLKHVYELALSVFFFGTICDHQLFVAPTCSIYELCHVLNIIKKTEKGLDNLLLRIDRMVTRLNPLFIDVTWGTNTQHKSLLIASHVQRYCGVDALLHLTCVDMTRGRMTEILNQCKYCGINNILVLRGDSAPSSGNSNNGMAKSQSKMLPTTTEQTTEEGFPYAIDLVKFIREKHGDYFSIAVAGHPDGRHRGISSTNSSEVDIDEDISYLKTKIFAGADYIITQFFYDADAFISFVTKCRNRGITCPIIPG